MAAKEKCFQAFGYPDEQFEAVISESLHCGICSCVFKDPVMCKNEHCFCRGCITKHLENYHTCPCCNQDLTVETLADAPRFFKNLLSEQRIRCDHHVRGCQEIVQLGNLASHVAVCGKAPVLCENEKCSSEINREDQFRHQNEECRFREVKCRNCKEMSSMVQEIGTSLDGLSEQVQKLDTSVTSVKEQSTEVKTGLTAFEDKFAEMENKFGDKLGGMENRFEKVEINCENAGIKFEKVKNKFIDRFKEMENRFKEVENQLLQIEDLRFRDGQHIAERDEKENARSDQACAAMSSSGMKDIKQPGEYAYLVAGGYGKDGKPLSSAEVFDKTSNSWIPLKPMKTCRAESSSVVYNGQVFVTGGTSDGKNILSNIEKFSSNVNPLVPPCWSYFPLNLPRALKEHYTVVYHDRMLVIGGYCEENKNYSNSIYEVQLHFPFTTKILAKFPSPRPMKGCGVVLLNDKILIFGGGERFWPTGSANVTMYDITKNEFKELEPLPYRVCNIATVKCGENVVLAGDQDGLAVRNSVISYNIETQKSTELPVMKKYRCECRAVVDGNSLVVMGGRNQKGNLESSVETLDFRTSKWRNLPSMKEARSAFTAEIV